MYSCTILIIYYPWYVKHARTREVWLREGKMRSLESFLQGKFCTEFSKRQTLLNLSSALKCKLHIIFIYAYNSEILNIVNRIKYLFVPYNSEVYMRLTLRILYCCTVLIMKCNHYTVLFALVCMVFRNNCAVYLFKFVDTIHVRIRYRDHRMFQS